MTRLMTRLPHSIPAILLSAALLPVSAQAQTEAKYQLPPDVMVKLIDAAPTPALSLSPAHAPGPRRILIQQSSSLPTIADLAEPELRLAGLRFNPKASAQSRTRYATSLKMQELPTGAAKATETAITGLPAHPHILYAQWSPDGRHVAFANQEAGGLSLWILDVAHAQAAPVAGIRLNAVLSAQAFTIFGVSDSAPFTWLNDTALAALTTPADRGPEPKAPAVPSGPTIEENLGKATPAPTYEDLLKTPYDEQVFNWNATSQIVEVKLDGTTKKVGKPGIFASLASSPDGKYLLTEELHTPFSYHETYERFPTRHSVYTVATGDAKLLEDSPLIDNLPIDRDAVEPGAREFTWRSDKPATVSFVKAADGGDPKKESAIRDRIYELDAPFTASIDQAKVIAELPIRFRAISWGNEHLAIVSLMRWKDRRLILAAIDPDAPATATVTPLYDGSMQDRYHNPGTPMLELNAEGKPVIATTPDGSQAYFSGAGASPKGDEPFVALMPVKAGAKPQETRIWQSKPPYYELAAAVIADASGARILARRESVTEAPNYFLTAPIPTSTTAPAASQWTQVTSFPNPYAGLPMPSHELLHYKRADGVDLTADLYLPAGYDKSKGPLPTLMEAYPAEFKSRAAASQVIGSPYEFTRIGWGSPVFFTMSGYAVMGNAAIPIIGEDKQEPNDTYVEQLVDGAKAGIDAGVATGAVDRNRVGVMGHSYGAFMTANLLAHSDLFRAGIARSGAYNRSLTPFGFQNEERTYWQAPEIYFKMSPFSYADKIKTPILLIHGEADNNTGTFTVQSERFFAALKGEGATARLVLLPLESHAYQGRESVLHMLWEMERWLDTYVKPETPVKPAS